MNNEELKQKLLLTGLQEVLREEDMDYTNDSIYGMMILLDSYVNDDLTVDEAVNEFIENSNVQVNPEVVQ